MSDIELQAETRSGGARRTAGDRPELRLLTSADLDPGIEVLAAAFAEEPGNVALFPDPSVRHAVWRAGARRALTWSIALGGAHAAVVDGEIAAIALWDPPGDHGRAGTGRPWNDLLPDLPTIVRGLPYALGVVGSQVRPAVRLSRARRRVVARLSRVPTWHLAFLATAASHRGRGLARSLLERQLARCDEDGLPVWLETTDPVNPPIYERFGFQTLLHLDDAAWLPGCWVMRRTPQADGR